MDRQRRGGEREGSGFLLDVATANPLGQFLNNAAHSNLAARVDTSEAGYNPSAQTALTGTKAFRNTGSGIRLRSSSGIVVSGGYAADNRDGVLVWKGESIQVTGTTVVGQSHTYKDMAAAIQGTPKLCTGYSDGPDVGGVRVHPNGGVTVLGVSFSGFDADAGCQPPSGGGTSVIAVVDDDPAMDLTFGSSITVSGLTFDAGLAPWDEVVRHRRPGTVRHPGRGLGRVPRTARRRPCRLGRGRRRPYDGGEDEVLQVPQDGRVPIEDANVE